MVCDKYLNNSIFLFKNTLNLMLWPDNKIGIHSVVKNNLIILKQLQLITLSHSTTMNKNFM